MGCKKRTKNALKHGEVKTRLYRTWNGMKKRILNSKSHNFKYYGGRGITICNEWLEFIPFRNWALSNGYSEGLTINRKINDGNYEPLNCEWITSAENNRNKRNKRNNKYTLEIIKEIRALWNTGNYTQKELAEKYNTTNKYIYKIINNK